jgi:hypothetical protein
MVFGASGCVAWVLPIASFVQDCGESRHAFAPLRKAVFAGEPRLGHALAPLFMMEAA